MPTKVLPILLPVLALSAACASSGVPAEDTSATWVSGEYVYQTLITYDDDTPSGSATGSVDVRGDVTVFDDGSLVLTSSTGRCRRTRTRDAALVDRREVRFNCGTASFVLRPGRDAVVGTVAMVLSETKRRRGGCRQLMTSTEGRQTCIAWDWNVTTNRAEKTANIRAQRPESAR